MANKDDEKKTSDTTRRSPPAKARASESNQARPANRSRVSGTRAKAVIGLARTPNLLLQTARIQYTVSDWLVQPASL
jgi:hypothetical protein